MFSLARQEGQVETSKVGTRVHIQSSWAALPLAQHPLLAKTPTPSQFFDKMLQIVSNKEKNTPLSIHPLTPLGVRWANQGRAQATTLLLLQQATHWSLELGVQINIAIRWKNLRITKKKQATCVCVCVWVCMHAQHTGAGTAQGAGAGQPSAGRCCAYLWWL